MNTVWKKENWLFENLLAASMLSLKFIARIRSCLLKWKNLSLTSYKKKRRSKNKLRRLKQRRSSLLMMMILLQLYCKKKRKLRNRRNNSNLKKIKLCWRSLESIWLMSKHWQSKAIMTWILSWLKKQSLMLWKDPSLLLKSTHWTWKMMPMI